jgi:hypothetical protein
MRVIGYEQKSDHDWILLVEWTEGILWWKKTRRQKFRGYPAMPWHEYPAGRMVNIDFASKLDDLCSEIQVQIEWWGDE